MSVYRIKAQKQIYPFTHAPGLSLLYVMFLAVLRQPRRHHPIGGKNNQSLIVLK